MKYLLSLILFISSLASAEVRVAIIDTGLDLNDRRFKSVLCQSGHEDFTGQGIMDVNGHGTHIAGLIRSYAGPSGYCLIIVKFYNDKASNSANKNASAEAFKYLKTLKPDVVNYSAGGPGESYPEKFIIESLLYTKFIVAAGNEGENIDKEPYYPASYNLDNIIPVGALDSEGKHRLSSSNYGSRVAFEIGENVLSTSPLSFCPTKSECFGYMSGSSISTAIHTGKIINSLLNSR